MKKQITVLRTELAATLPQDRESLYWLNLYEISAVKKERYSRAAIRSAWR
ncbi:fimbria/pilus periplasmic chaperone [Pantoea stewartii]